MIEKELEGVADLGDTHVCEKFSMPIDSSVLRNQNRRSRGGDELQRRLKKLRSIKLSKSPSLKPSSREGNNRSNHLVFSDEEGSICSATIARNLQNSASKNLIRGSSFKPVRNLGRISSLKFKNPSMRKSNGGGSQVNDNVKKSRMVKISSRKKKSANSDADSSSPIVAKEAQFQASSPHTSESSYCSSNETRTRSVFSNPNSKTCPSHKSPLNVSSKLGAEKSNKCSMRKHSDQISQFQDLNVQRATCSSALKGSKSPDIRGVQAEGSEFECPFTYCSLHGHRHAYVPPLKRLISIRRCMLKTQRIVAPATQSPVRVKRSGKITEYKKNQLIGNGLGEVHETSPVAEKSGREMLLEVYAEPQVKASGLGTSSENGEDNDNISNISEKLLDETYYADDMHVEENLHNALEIDGLSPEVCCAEIDLVATNRDRKEEEIAASNSDPISLGKCLEAYDCTTVIPPDVLGRSIPDEVVGSTRGSEHSLSSSASGFQVLEDHNADSESKNGSVEPESKPSNVGHSVLEKDVKYIRMWKLMYKHAVKGTNENVESQLPVDGPNKGEQVEGTNPVFETNNLNISETGEHIALINHSGGDQHTERIRHDAIKLVQDAFDNILLPEVQDRSYDDQSFTSGISSDHGAFGQSQDEGGEQSSSTFNRSSEDIVVQNQEKWVEAENASAHKVEKTVSKVGDNKEKKTPKSWSSLKNFILLKRFVKAVEKVRNLNYRKPQYLSPDSNSDAEKVNLRQQKTEERKNAEEWMLDYALQEVMSKLPSDKKRRVALLVEAFETVLPFPQIKTRQKSGIGLSIQSADHTGKECYFGNSSEILPTNMSCSEEIFSEYPVQVRDVQAEDQKIPVNLSKLKDSGRDQYCIKERGRTSSGVIIKNQKEKHTVALDTGNGNENGIITCGKTDLTSIGSSEVKDGEGASLKRDECGSNSFEGLVNETFEVAPKDVTSITSLDLGNMNSKVENIKSETKKFFIGFDVQMDSSEDQFTDNNVVSSASIKPTEESVAARDVRGGAMRPECGFVQGEPSLEESHADHNTGVPHETKLEKQKYSNLWFLVYKHMVSSIDAEDRDKPLDGALEEQVDDINRSPRMDNHGSFQSLSERDEEMGIKDHYSVKKKIELRHIEAIKLQVEKAIDEIILPENQDESDDDKSSSGDLSPDQEPLENKVDIDGKSFISVSINSANDNSTMQEDEKAVAKVEYKPHKKLSKNWSNLKKMILLNRFVKALENVKKFSPRGPKYLPMELDPEAEKVHLKQQSMDEKKNSEEWMLDYALQRAVSRLTPARKRKVSLLVEAFETVIPNNGIPNPFKPQVAP